MHESGGMGAADSAMSQPSCIFLFSTIPFQAAFNLQLRRPQSFTPEQRVIATRHPLSAVRRPLAA
jgi:hypothetical protein